MVRKDMINNAVGYREASITDFWSGQGRFNEKTRQAFVDTATFFMGKHAFKILATAEKGIQAGVSVAKNTIVIRSVIVHRRVAPNTGPARHGPGSAEEVAEAAQCNSEHQRANQRQRQKLRPDHRKTSTAK